MIRAQRWRTFVARNEFHMKLFSRRHASGTPADTVGGDEYRVDVDGGYAPDTLVAALTLGAHHRRPQASPESSVPRAEPVAEGSR